MKDRKGLRFVVADDEPDMRDYFRKILPRLGHELVAVATNGTELVDLCKAYQPDMVITDIKMPDMDGIEAAIQIFAQRPVPVILVSAYHDTNLISRAEADHIMAYLVKPIKQADLEPTISLAKHRFDQFQILRQEAENLRLTSEDRAVVERATAILMKRGSLEEHVAFKRLQKMAVQKSRKLTEIAQMILVAEEALLPISEK